MKTPKNQYFQEKASKKTKDSDGNTNSDITGTSNTIPLLTLQVDTSW